MHFEILVHPQGIQCSRIKTREEHTHNNQQVHFPVLHSHGQVFVVVLELIGGSIKVCIECSVVILNRTIEKVTGSLIEGIRIEAFLLQNIFGIIPICGITENRCNRKPAVTFSNLPLKLLVILHCHRNGADSKHGIEACHALALQGIEAVSFGFLVKMRQRVFDDFPNTLRRPHRPFNVDCRNILVLDVLFFLDRIHIIDTERKHIAVIDCIHDGVGMELITKGLRRGQ